MNLNTLNEIGTIEDTHTAVRLLIDEHMGHTLDDENAPGHSCGTTCPYCNVLTSLDDFLQTYRSNNV